MNSILFKVLPAPALSARALPPSLCVLPPLALSVRGSARLYACGSAWLGHFCIVLYLIYLKLSIIKSDGPFCIVLYLIYLKLSIIKSDGPAARRGGG